MFAHSFGLHGTSASLFITAKEAAKRARASAGTVQEQLEAMTSIVLSGVVAEASINEIGDWFEFHRLRPPFSIPSQLPYGFEQMELRTKWSLLPLIVRGRTFDSGAEPWQSFHALIQLRNYIVHIRPDRPLLKSVTSLLVAKKLIPNDQRSQLVFCFEVARWACETMAEMFAKLTDLVDPPKDWIGLLWCWTPAWSFPRGLSTPGDP
jgi:hypothetical protein